MNLLSETRLSPCRRNAFAFLSLFIITLAIYSNSLDCSWHFDDNQNILERKAIQITQLSWSEIKKTFFMQDGQRQGELYRPVPNFSFAINYFFGKTNVFGYHLTNISIHILTSFFLFLFIYHILNLPAVKPRYGADSYLIALLAAVFWVINPVQTQAVTYIVQRMASMAAMFYIMAMYFYVKGRVYPQRKMKAFYYSMCFISGLLAVGSKENAAMLPISILLLDFFMIQGVSKENLRKYIWILLGLITIPLFFALLLKGPSLFSLEGLLEPYENIRPFTLVQRLLTEPRIILFYLSLLFYPMPHRLSITHDISISHSLIDPFTTVLAIGMILGILAASFFYARRRPLLAYCIIFFFLNHVIEGSVFGLELIFEHRNYLPSMLLFVPVAILLGKTIRFYSGKTVMQAILTVFIILVLIGFGNSTYLRNGVWKTEGTLWADAVAKAPNLIRPHLNLGNYYYSQRMYEKAQAQYMEGSLKKPAGRKIEVGLIYYNLGLIYLLQENTDVELEYYKKSIRVYAGHADTYNNMATAFYRIGQKKKADIALKTAIRCCKKHIKAHRNLVLFAFSDGDLEKAAHWINRALIIAPNNVAVLGSAGYYYRLKGSFGRAFMLFEKTLLFDNYDPKVDLYIAEIFFKRKMYDHALKHIEKFAAGAKDNDLGNYVQGTYKKEDEIGAIRPYKKQVLFALSRIYENKSSYLNEKADYVKNMLADIEKKWTKNAGS